MRGARQNLPFAALVTARDPWRAADLAAEIPGDKGDADDQQQKASGFHQA